MDIPSESLYHQPSVHKSQTTAMSTSNNFLPLDLLLDPSSHASTPPSRRAFSSVPDCELEAALGLTPSTVCTKSYQSKQPILSPHSNNNSLTQDTIPPSLIPPLPPASRHSSSTVSPPPSPLKPVEPPTNTSGLSAVELAKRAAEEFTLAELKKKRRNANGVPLEAKRLKIDSSCSDQDCPEKISHKKYQKRLQKNRDSAFVSRIRRREYTKILEKSLVQVEKEKNAALACFNDMKRRFELVSAELNGMKHVAQTNIARITDPLTARIDDGEEHSPVRPGGTVTMFMFALIFGALVPDFGKSSGNHQPSRYAISNYFPRLWDKAVQPRVSESVESQRKGNVWGGPTRRSRGTTYTTLSNRQLLLANVQGDVQQLHVKKDLSSFVDELGELVGSMSEKDVDVLNKKLQEVRDNTEMAEKRLLWLVRYLENHESVHDEDQVLTSISKSLSSIAIEE